MQLLKSNKNNVSSKIDTVTELLAANIIFPVTRGKLLTVTHFFLAMNLYSITRSRKVTDILNKLRQCIDYKRERNKPNSANSKAGEHLINPTITAFSR